MSVNERYRFEDLGLNASVLQELEDAALPGSKLARIVRVDRGLPLASYQDNTTRVELAPALARIANKDSLARLAVGDWVVLSFPEGHETPLVEKILSRSSLFLRKDPADLAQAQVVISNVDIIFVLVAFSKQGINVARLERYLVLAFESGARPIIVVTKADLVDEDEERTQLEEVKRVAAGVEVIAESAITLEGLDQIAAHLKSGVTAAMVGASGVGKSTLANRLLGSDVLDAQEVRERDDKGRHTTVARELVVLPQGGVLIDTPGIRTIALWSADDGLDLAFPEIYEASQRCRFADCKHNNEPDCGVRAAIEQGEVDEMRFVRYLKLRDELDDVEKSRIEQKRRGKS